MLETLDASVHHGAVIEIVLSLFLAQTKGDYVYLVPIALETQELTENYLRYISFG